MAPATTKEKKPSSTRKPKTAKGSKPPPDHPTYLHMVSEAVSSLKERGGSSPYAISKYMEDKYKKDLPPNFRKLLAVQLKNLTKQGKLIRVKNSYKLSDELKKAAKSGKPEEARPAKPPHEIKAKNTVVRTKPAKISTTDPYSRKPAKAVKSAAKPSKPSRSVKKPAKPKAATKIAKPPRVKVAALSNPAKALQPVTDKKTSVPVKKVEKHRATTKKVALPKLVPPKKASPLKKKSVSLKEVPSRSAKTAPVKDKTPAKAAKAKTPKKRGRPVGKKARK